MRDAALLVTVPALFVIATVNLSPLSAAAVGGVVYDDEVAPLIGLPFSFHWYVSGVVPLAATLKVAVAGAVTLWLLGCVVIDGAVLEGVGEGEGEGVGVGAGD